MNDDQLRIGDAERAAAAADLGEHFAQGRLSAEEHEERLTTVLAARTRADLAPVFADLPSPYAAAPAPSPTMRSGDRSDRYWNSGLRPFRRGVPTPIVVVVATLLAITIVTHVPFILIGLLAIWFVTHRHHGPRSHHRSWRY